MIIDNTHNVSTNLKDSKEFSVSDDSAKIFSFLSNFLYKDKERSVITELCSNGLDAHRMVGKEALPLLIHLPTELQREFRVRDYGPGLTEAQVYQFLTKYGSSSKGQTNDDIGGFGIGSKSPAAVSDTWTINSHIDGDMSSYLIHVNDKGIPSINKLFVKPTNETGLEVIVPTKNNRMWHDAAARVFFHYDVMPDVKGTYNTLSQATFTSDFHGLIKFARNQASGSAQVLMNRRAYDVDLSKIKEKLYFNQAGYLPFPTSSLSVSLSREDLQYDSRTSDAIKTRIEEINKKLAVLWKTDVSPKTSIYEYQQAAADFRKTNNINTDGCYFFSKGDKFVNQVDFNNLSSFTLKLDSTESNIQVVEAGHAKMLVVGRYAHGGSNVKYFNDSWSNPLKSIQFISHKKGDIVFVLRDVKDSPSRVKQAQKLINTPTAIIMDKQWFDLIPDSFTKVAASTFDKAARTPRVATVKIKSNIWVQVGNQFTRFDEAGIDKTKKHIVLKFKNARSASSKIDSTEAKITNEFPESLTGKVFYIKEDEAFPAYAITAQVWAEAKYNELIVKKDVILDMHKLGSLKSKSSYDIIGYMFRNRSRFSGFDKKTVVGSIVEEMETLTLSGGLTDKTIAVTLNKLSNILNKPGFKPNDLDYNAKLLAAYPMLRIINTGYFNDEYAKLSKDYMLLCGM